MKPRQRMRCLSEKARVFVLFGRYQVANSALPICCSVTRARVLQDASNLFDESSRLNGSDKNVAAFRLIREWGDCLTAMVHAA